LGCQPHIQEADARAALMDVKWTSKALSDLVRVYEFAAPTARRSAARAIQRVVASPVRLREFPRIGEKLDEFDPREVRRILVGQYEVRYEISEQIIYILRVWHTREER
jgi:plasmid stabilization system protein ParE